MKKTLMYGEYMSVLANLSLSNGILVDPTCLLISTILHLISNLKAPLNMVSYVMNHPNVKVTVKKNH